MKDSKLREWLPVVVCLGFVPVGAVVAGATACWFPQHALWLLLSLVIFGGLGIYFGDWPPIEYAIALILTAVLAGMLVPFVLIGVGFPGAFVGYLWGGYFAGILDKPNIERLRHASRDESADT